MKCEECGCPLESHNAVNKVDSHLIAHCGKCGACWTERDSPFVERLAAYIKSLEEEK